MIKLYKSILGKYNHSSSQQVTGDNPTFRKKWLACLWLYFLDFNRYREPTSPVELYNSKAKYLGENDISSLSAFSSQTNVLKKERYLYTIKPKPFNYSVPFRYMISKKGISRVAFEGLISVEKKEKMRRIASDIAENHGISIRS